MAMLRRLKAVDIASRIMLKGIESNTDPYLDLLVYQNIPIDGEESPAQLLMSRSLRSILPCTQQQQEPNNVPKTKFLKARTSQQERQKQNYDKTSKDLIELKDNQHIWVKLSKEATCWMKGAVTSCISPRSYLIQAEDFIAEIGPIWNHGPVLKATVLNNLQDSQGMRTFQQNFTLLWLDLLLQKRLFQRLQIIVVLEKSSKTARTEPQELQHPLQQQTVKAETERIIHDPM